MKWTRHNINRQFRRWFNRTFERAAPEHRLYRHTLRFDHETGSVILFAPPGSGKGTCFVIPTLLSNGRDSIFCLDPAGQNAAIARQWLMKSGVDVHVFNPTGVLSDELLGAPAQCNPLGAKNVNDPMIETELQEDAAILVTVNKGDTQSYFAASAQSLVAAVALSLLETQGSAANWPMVSEVLHLPLHRLNDLFEVMTVSRFPSVRQVAAKYFVPNDAEGKPRRALTTAMLNVIENAQQDTAFLNTGGIATMLSRDGVRFSAGKQRRTAFFVCMGDNGSEALQKCAHLLLATAKRQLCTAGGIPMAWIIDEAAAATPPAAAAVIKSMLDLTRKYGHRLALICQSYPQFISWAGDEHKAHALMASSGASIFYGANDVETIAVAQQLAGKYTVWKPTTSPLAEFGIEGSTTPQGVELLTDSALRDQHRKGQQSIFVMGSKRAIVIPRVPYFKIPELLARAAPDPYRMH